MAEHYMGVTLRGAKDWLLARLDKGEKCPCCHQFAKMYRRTINGAMVRALANLYKAGGGSAFGYGHLPDMDPSKGDAAKLVYWDLIEEERGVREDGGRAGYWRVTELGEEFLQGTIKLPKHARVYDQRLFGLDDTETVTIHDCWGKPFDLRELMDE
jgi:hypothetical protein